MRTRSGRIQALPNELEVEFMRDQGVKQRTDFDVIEGGRHVGDYPKDQP
jgi:hypothetical protein